MLSNRAAAFSCGLRGENPYPRTLWSRGTPFLASSVGISGFVVFARLAPLSRFVRIAVYRGDSREEGAKRVKRTCENCFEKKVQIPA